MAKKYTNYSSYGLSLSLALVDAEKCSHSGECYEDVKEVIKKPYVKKQVALFDKETLIKELSEYGAWNNEDLSDHKENVIRFVWVSAGSIIENLSNE